MVFEPLLQGFAAFGSVVGVGSAYLAFDEWVRGGLVQSNPRISQAISAGVAISFVPAVVLGTIVLSYATTL